MMRPMAEACLSSCFVQVVRLLAEVDRMQALMQEMVTRAGLDPVAAFAAVAALAANRQSSKQPRRAPVLMGWGRRAFTRGGRGGQGGDGGRGGACGVVYSICFVGGSDGRPPGRAPGRGGRDCTRCAAAGGGLVGRGQWLGGAGGCTAALLSFAGAGALVRSWREDVPFPAPVTVGGSWNEGFRVAVAPNSDAVNLP